jgi:membrane fusion protein (multidrug efflux system)
VTLFVLLVSYSIDVNDKKIKFAKNKKIHFCDPLLLDVQVAAYPQERFRGSVYFVDPMVSPSTRTVLVKARVPNPDRRLRAGMFANVALILQVRPRAVVIPEAALLLEGEQASVFVVEQQAAQRRPVTPGIRMAGTVEIVRGLSRGELVVVEGTQKLAPGAPVEAREDARPLAEVVRGAVGLPVAAGP